MILVNIFSASEINLADLKHDSVFDTGIRKSSGGKFLIAFKHWMLLLKGFFLMK